MLGSIGQLLPLLHELLLGHAHAQAKPFSQLMDQTLLTEHEWNVVDGWTIRNVDHLTRKKLNDRPMNFQNLDVLLMALLKRDYQKITL